MYQAKSYPFQLVLTLWKLQEKLPHVRPTQFAYYYPYLHHTLNLIIPDSLRLQFQERSKFGSLRLSTHLF